jgi:hypothetical protein
MGGCGQGVSQFPTRAHVKEASIRQAFSVEASESRYPSCRSVVTKGKNFASSFGVGHLMRASIFEGSIVNAQPCPWKQSREVPPLALPNERCLIFRLNDFL